MRKRWPAGAQCAPTRTRRDDYENGFPGNPACRRARPRPDRPEALPPIKHDRLAADGLTSGLEAGAHREDKLITMRVKFIISHLSARNCPLTLRHRQGMMGSAEQRPYRICRTSLVLQQGTEEFRPKGGKPLPAFSGPELRFRMILADNFCFSAGEKWCSTK